jgi:hypothetical protein
MSKIAIVGCRASGKTVFMASLADYFRAGQRENQTSWLIPENVEAHKFTEMRNYEMRVKHEWPDTTWQAPTSLKWSLHLQNGTSTDVEMLEFSGEVFRAAFREEEASPQYRAAAETLVDYLIDAKFVVVLVALNELYRDKADQAQFAEDIESTWVTRGLIEFVKKNLPKDVGLLIALTQADLYKEELKELGGAANVLKKKWPMIYALYPDVPVVAVASVSQTTADGRPAEGYTTEGVLPVMKAYSEYLYGSPNEIISELEGIYNFVVNPTKALDLGLLRQKLSRHQTLIDELRNKVTIVDALYDEVISKHQEFNQATFVLCDEVQHLVEFPIEGQQDEKHWNLLREKFPSLTKLVDVYQQESEASYLAVLAEQKRAEEAEQKRREDEEQRLKELAQEEEERKRQLELKEKAQSVAAEEVRLAKERARAVSKLFALRAICIVVILLIVTLGVKMFFEKRREFAVAEKARIESDNFVKYAGVHKAKAEQRTMEEKNRAEELRQKRIEAENRQKELDLRKLEAERKIELERKAAEEAEREKARLAQAQAQAQAQLAQKQIELELKKAEAEKALQEAKMRQSEEETKRLKMQIEKENAERLAQERKNDELEKLSIEAKLALLEKNANQGFLELRKRFRSAVTIGDVHDAQNYVEQMEEVRDYLNEENEHQLALVYYDLGVLYMTVPGSQRSYKKANDYLVLSRKLGNKDPDIAVMLGKCRVFLSPLEY